MDTEYYIVKQPWAVKTGQPVFWIRHLTSLCISHPQNEHNDSYLIVKKFNDISVHCLAYTKCPATGSHHYYF